jgi:hypothetical protein
MAEYFYNKAREEIANGTINLLTDTIKAMLVSAVYTPDPDHLVVDAGGASDPLDAEISVTGYTPGWGGAGRKTLGTKSIAADNTLDLAKFAAADLTWVALGAGATIAWVLVIKEGGVNDTTSRLISAHAVSAIATNGQNFNVAWHPTRKVLTF